ncbi:peptidoglycan editing factor PgeF [Mariprofundus sp. EBB-1]|uniref:peptidoglycan editing factor PgeF n=1 Tax=Mariprofundus sp. EBB-1 TaxID=2650971 RepID=UPI000EF1A80E|nr:peptidoglycan editing factor PgeF [Mariprofundus sp. EBB-1]RLL51020.1 peptidoglycan editing factor PgeF [Mariprofundus sp. EBB-1]
MANLSVTRSAFIESKLFNRYGIRGIFTTRSGGISPAPFDSQNFGSGLGDPDANIEHNLHRLLDSSDIPGPPHQAIQTHQIATLWCNGPGYMHSTEADILLSSQHNTPLAIRTADCLPILLADPATGITAAVHAGWRGTASNVVQHAVQAMLNRGASSAHILASLGPCIGSCCFNIGADVATALKNSVIGAESFVNDHADLRQINRLQILDSGLSEGNIECINACTACDKAQFFSFRRDAGVTGRHIAVVAIASKP